MESGQKQSGQVKPNGSLHRRIAAARLRARLAILVEKALPLTIAPLLFLSLFLSAAWLGLFAVLPDWVRWTSVFLLLFGFLASLLPFRALRLASTEEADRRLERQNRLPHQAISIQDDEPVSETAFSRALWERHRERMQSSITALEAGAPAPDVSRFDPAGLRAFPALVLAVAFGFSFSASSGRISDAFRNHAGQTDIAGLRVDIWVTPPGYTGKPAITLSPEAKTPSVPQFSEASVRISGSSEPVAVSYASTEGGSAVPINPQSPAKGDAAPAETYKLRLTTDGVLTVAGRTYPITLIPDRAPQIDFDGQPRRSANGSLEIRFRASDDYGLKSARADIVPLDEPPQAEPLFPLPDYPLDLPRGQGHDVKGVSSRNLTEHPLAGKRVRISLLAEDGAGQTGRSAPIDMTLPARAFGEPLAAAIAEERQIFSLDVRNLNRAIEYNDALTLRGDESIPNLTHYLLIKSARARMALARDEASLKDMAAYLWEMALGIDGGDVSVAEKNVRDAQKALSDALKRNAPDKEIQALMEELRKAMKDYMAALAKRMQNAKPDSQMDAKNVLRQQDLERMMDQLENMARSGNKDAAQELLNQMQRMMNNLQAGPSQQRPPSEAEKKARDLADQLGKLLTEQQKLMEDTYKENQDRQQQEWNSQSGQDGMDPNQDPGQPGKMSEDQKKRLDDLRSRQEALQKKLQELGKGMKELGMKPGKGLGKAGREMEGAGKALGDGEGEQAVEGQGRAIEALRQGAKEMMQAMGGKGQGGSQAGIPMPGGSGGQDPLGQSRDDGQLGDSSDGKIPDEIDVQRAREILDSIRRKLGEGSITPTGKQYLERLLNLN